MWAEPTPPPAVGAELPIPSDGVRAVRKPARGSSGAAGDITHLAVLCTYPLAACGATEILDVVRTHQFAVTRRRGNWDVIETAGHKQAKAEIKRLIEELEQRVIERTSQLAAVNEDLTNEVLERQRAEGALRQAFDEIKKLKEQLYRENLALRDETDVSSRSAFVS